MSYLRDIPVDDSSFIDYLLETGPFTPPADDSGHYACGGGSGLCDLDAGFGSLLGHLNLHSLFHFYSYTIIVAYPLYRFISALLQFPSHEKSFVRHERDILNAFLYGFVLYVLGGFQESGSNRCLVIWFYIGLFGFGLGTKLLNLSAVNLTNVRSWTLKTWTVMGVVQTVILIGAYYLLLSVCSGHSLSTYSLHSTNKLLGLKIVVPLALFLILLLHYLLYDHSSHVFHLHHWQIFYTLAMLYSGGSLDSDSSSSGLGANTCQVFIGLFMGAYMHGVISYGYDPIIVKKDAGGKEMTEV